MHRIAPSSVDLTAFGKPTGFYDRQIKTLSRISRAQSLVLDNDTQDPVGPIPHFDAMISFFSRRDCQPRDRGALIHGDYKIDNLVFHATEPRVVGILDWEMATIGHPLSDLVNLTGPWSWMQTPSSAASGITRKFEVGATPGLPTLEQCVAWYAEAAGWDPSPELAWGNAFGGLRGAVIMQGIAARYAMRSASGETAAEFAAQMKPHGEWTWQMVEALKRPGKRKDATSKL